MKSSEKPESNMKETFIVMENLILIKYWNKKKFM